MDIEDLRFAAYLAVALVPALVLHEYAHAFVAVRLGDPTPKRWGRLTLNPRPLIDPFGSLILPALALILIAARGQLLLPVFAYAKPMPLDPSYLKDPKRDSGHATPGRKDPRWDGAFAATRIAPTQTRRFVSQRQRVCMLPITPILDVDRLLKIPDNAVDLLLALPAWDFASASAPSGVTEGVEKSPSEPCLSQPISIPCCKAVAHLPRSRRTGQTGLGSVMPQPAIARWWR